MNNNKKKSVIATTTTAANEIDIEIVSVFIFDIF
jgi:hypothetical protein